MAYYDYDPSRQGPVRHGFKQSCEDELSLRTGDFIVVYGDMQLNGFYTAEVNRSDNPRYMIGLM